MSNLQLYPAANTIILDAVSVCLSDKDFKDPEIISLRQGEDNMEGKYILTFGRNACKATLTPTEAQKLQKDFGVQLK